MSTEPWPHPDTISLNGQRIPSAHSITIDQPGLTENWSKAEEARWWTAVPKSLPGPQLGMWPVALLRRFYSHHLPRRLRRGKK